jgi:hypothetical protein
MNKQQRKLTLEYTCFIYMRMRSLAVWQLWSLRIIKREIINPVCFAHIFLFIQKLTLWMYKTVHQGTMILTISENIRNQVNLFAWKKNGNFSLVSY